MPRAYGEPLGRGRIRASAEDFQVEETLGFSPDAEGDHLLLWVRKTDANTEWVARKLAAVAKAPVSTVGYAGLKDRHAVTLQWFSVPRPRDIEPDWTVLESLGIEVLAAHAHRRKLRRGALAGNRFRILIRDFAPAAEQLSARLSQMRERGVPNYFGDQRFGHADGNLLNAHALLTGTAGRAPRHVRGLWLSAARSQIFNEVLAERVRDASWDRLQTGECVQLDGSRSQFVIDQIDPDLSARATAMDLHPTGPLWGVGELPSRDGVHQLETAVAARFQPWAEGLVRQGLDQERRALRLSVADLNGTQQDSDLLLEFWLPSGAYATAVLRELVEV